MILIISILLFLIFIFLSLLHAYWALGGKWASRAVIPEINDSVAIHPPAFVTLIVASGLLIFALIVIGNTRLVNLWVPNYFFKYGMWSIGLLFLARAIGEFKFIGFFKKIKHTKFAYWDTRLYSPLCLLIAALSFLIISQ